MPKLNNPLLKTKSDWVHVTMSYVRQPWSIERAEDRPSVWLSFRPEIGAEFRWPITYEELEQLKELMKKV